MASAGIWLTSVSSSMAVAVNLTASASSWMAVVGSFMAFADSWSAVAWN